MLVKELCDCNTLFLAREMLLEDVVVVVVASVEVKRAGSDDEGSQSALCLTNGIPVFEWSCQEGSVVDGDYVVDVLEGRYSGAERLQMLPVVKRGGLMPCSCILRPS